MQRLSNPVRPYAWGTTTVIPALLGVEPDGGPQAELWVGAHPDSPSTLSDGTTLEEVVRLRPLEVLGRPVEDRFGDRLPFLLKVLSAAAPLSLQVHPDAEQAAAGYAAEERAGVPDAASERRYHDPYHKPEMVLALGRFEALCGVRPLLDTRRLLAGIDVVHPAWSGWVDRLHGPDERGAVTEAVRWLLGDDPEVGSMVQAVSEACARVTGSAETTTAAALGTRYPRDPGVVVALLLHRVTLTRGDALYLTAGNVHAYLEGTAVEVMAASDNVLRLGLTSKHVDADELLRVADLTPGVVPWVAPAVDRPFSRYRPGAAEFELTVAELSDDAWHDTELTGPRVLLVLEGSVEATTGADPSGGPTRLDHGEAALVDDADGALHLRGHGVAVVASVPGC